MKQSWIFLAALALALFAFDPAFAQVQGQWTNAGTMQSAREFDAQTLLNNGPVLAIGGVDNSGTVLASTELYNPTSNLWVSQGSLATARESFAAVTLQNGVVLVMGGLGAGGTVLNSTEIYNPSTGTWSSVGSMSVARYDHSATLLMSGKVLVTGGCTVSGCGAPTGVSEIFDPATASWSTSGSLNTARANPNAVLLHDGRVLAIGGLAGVALASAELYNPSTGAWTLAATANSPRYLSTATLLPSGKVLVAGGASGKYPVSSAELYDPNANTWTLTGAMKAGRYAHSATALPDGTVLIVGGVSQSTSCGKACTGYIPTAKTEIYNDAAGTFAAATSLAVPLAYQAATALKSGRALTAGGSGTTSVCCTVESSAQYYIPLTLTFSSGSLNFGLLQIGDVSAAQTVTVTNVSAHSVTIASIAASVDYAQTNTCPASLGPSLSCTISVTFKPTVAGTRNGSLTLNDESPGSSTQTITLYGTGETLALGFSPSSINVGSISVGSSGSAVATLTSDGGAPVTLSGFVMAPANGTFTQTNACPASLAVQQTCTIHITFTPPDVSTYTATLSVANSAGAAAVLSLSGVGLDGP